MACTAPNAEVCSSETDNDGSVKTLESVQPPEAESGGTDAEHESGPHFDITMCRVHHQNLSRQGEFKSLLGTIHLGINEILIFMELGF